MHIYNNLWDKFICDSNIDVAATEAIKSKKSRASIKQFLQDRDHLLSELKELLNSGKYRTSEYREKHIFEPKERLIYVLPLYPDHIVHHALINVLAPIWQPQFIRDSYACIPGRGLHDASRRVMHFIRRNKYVLQCDIRKFFPSMNHAILLDIICRQIKDARLIRILREIIYSVDGETNVPIGNLTSQWFGNVYLNELDQFVKHTLRWKDYIRYCDDFCLFSNDKNALHSALKQIEIFVTNRLQLQFSKRVVYPTSRGVDFLGYRHFKKFILLRRRTAARVSRRIRDIIVGHSDKRKTLGRLGAVYGWSKWANSYHYRKKLCKLAAGSELDGLMRKYLLPTKK